MDEEYCYLEYYIMISDAALTNTLIAAYLC